MHRARVSRLCIHILRTKYQLIILSENYNTPILTGVTTILANLSNSQFTTILFVVYESRPHRCYPILPTRSLPGQGPQSSDAINSARNSDSLHHGLFMFVFVFSFISKSKMLSYHCIMFRAQLSQRYRHHLNVTHHL